MKSNVKNTETMCCMFLNYGNIMKSNIYRSLISVSHSVFVRAFTVVHISQRSVRSLQVRKPTCVQVGTGLRDLVGTGSALLDQ